MVIVCVDQHSSQPDTDALICNNMNGKVGVEHYLASNGYDKPSRTNPVSKKRAALSVIHLPFDSSKAKLIKVKKPPNNVLSGQTCDHPTKALDEYILLELFVFEEISFPCKQKLKV